MPRSPSDGLSAASQLPKPSEGDARGSELGKPFFCGGNGVGGWERGEVDGGGGGGGGFSGGHQLQFRIPLNSLRPIFSKLSFSNRAP